MYWLSGLWLPILLSSVLVFVASSILHMALPWHKSDFLTLPNEDRARDALRSLSIPPGDYMVPRPSGREDMNSPQFAEKMKTGPVAVFTVMPSGQMAIGRNLAMWFAYCVAISVCVAYIVGHTLPVGNTTLHQEIRISGTTAFLAYSAALWPQSIWYRRSWTTTVKSTVDGFVYALVTAAAFAWLAPR